MGIAVALALTALVGVAQASANNFKTEVEPETWSGSRVGREHQLVLGASEGESLACSKVSFSGETKNKSVGELTVTPELNGCSYLGTEVGWATHGCKYRFHPGKGEQLVGSMDIVGCEKPMTLSVPGCTTEIGNQKGLGTVEYKNVGTGSTRTVTMVANLASLTYTRTGTGCFGATGTFHNGTYSGEWTAKGTASGSQRSVEVEATPPAPNTVFAAEEAPVTIAGLNSENLKRFAEISGNGVRCENYALSGTSASVTPESITLTPVYKGCTVGGEAVPNGFVSAGGCSYVLHANGKFDIAGATCASKPMTITRAGCVVTIGPQSGLSGFFSYTNEGSGKLRAVSMSGFLSDVTYTAVGPSCLQLGTFSTGGIDSVSKLTATNSIGVTQGISVE
jgi:hypothetical protein